MPGVGHTVRRVTATLFVWVGRGQPAFSGDIPAGGEPVAEGKGRPSARSPIFQETHGKLTLRVSGIALKAVALVGPWLLGLPAALLFLQSSRQLLE